MSFDLPPYDGPLVIIPLALLAALLTGWLLVRAGLLDIPDETRRLGCLDGLRGYLALMVAVHHFDIWRNVFQGLSWGAPSGHLYNNLGQAGVGLFFMASGALFYRKVAKEMLRLDWVSLYLSRLFRIVPLMWLATALVLLLVLYRGGTPQSSDGAALLKWLTFVANPDLMGHPHTSRIIAHVVWSLRYEWVFYFALPLLALVLSVTSPRRVPNILVLIAGTAVLLFVPGLWFGPFAGILISFFGLGMIAVELASWPRVNRLLSRWPVAFLGIAALATQMKVFPGAFNPISGVLLFAFFTPVLAGNSYFGLLTRKGSIALGEVSYGIYLLHGIVLSVWMEDLIPRIGERFGASWLALPLLLVIIVLLATLTFLLVEKPMITAGKHLARLRRPARARA
ncbi:hypothetical protein CDV52_09020 [Haematobacter missouriensis]|uniref:Acyltransferase 3 domain-containing protein n=1 Tax=Haematobacter missouriensis TaxID=366616 RepID=A0A212ARC7_9RHOB|nr:acyltransferase [Haematobacter missouriensis]OWJ84024.1 hypothetical protein CDV52_09020 [Haematobacter missouriensis]